MDYFDASERRCRLNPVIMHALAIIEALGSVSAARETASLQIQNCPGPDYRHWLHLYAVLTGEIGGAA